YIRYVDSQDPAVFHDGQQPIAPSDLNLASVASSKVAGTLSTARTVTSVDSGPRHWDAAITVPGFDAKVTAAGTGSTGFDIAPGATQQLTVSAQATTAGLDKYAFGALTLTSGATTLHLPVSLRAIAISAPETVQVTADQSSGRPTIPGK